MKTMTAKELKNHTGKVMRSISRGEKIVLTLRGEPTALILPIAETEKKKSVEVRPFQDAWDDIEQTLKASKPRFETWQKALGWSRKRM